MAPGAPATIRFTADAPGRFELELEQSGVQIAELEVRPDPARAWDRRRQRPARPGLALLLGRRGRPHPLVPRAGRALEASAARAPLGRTATARLARARAPLRRSPPRARGALGRPARARLPGGADRGAVLGDEPVADVRLRRLLARARAGAGAVRQRLAGPQPVARGRRRGRLALAEARTGVDAAARVPRAARRLARGRPPLLLRRAGARLRRAGQPAGARARDRPLQLRDVVRHGRVREADLGRPRQRLHRLLRTAGSDRAVRRARGPARRQGASRAWPARSGCPGCSRSSR